MHQSPLHDRHAAAGAKFAEFGGWEMPLQYSGVLDEHQAVREAVGVFDVSHLGKASVIGPDALHFLNGILANDLAKAGPGKAQYTLLCNDSGGVVDDLIAYVNGTDDVFLIPNAANTAEVVDILAAAAPAGIQVTNRHHDFAVVAVQGPKSDEVLSALGYPVGHGYMSFTWVDSPVLASVCRTGYTGERGYELVCAAGDAAAVWDAVLAAGEPFGIRPAGLGARDTLRTEMGYSLHGHEITPGIDPVSAGLSWAIGWAKPGFAGKAALAAIKAEGPARRSRGLKALGRGIPRPGMTVVDADGAEIGTVTSGTFSPSLKQGIGLALIDTAHGLGERVGVQVRNRVEEFELVKPPFVQPSVRG
ncbi:MAG: glycine cleavage system aminomethyltransferase GcvT [Propionibacteriaceae bacterium]|nr:glycine cleavage system aminomethyltransferase GcvT [Propionibacteriaceae bacterium]